MESIDPSNKIVPGKLPAKTLVSEKVETKGDRRSSIRYGPPSHPARPPASSKRNKEETTGDEHLVDIVI